MCSSTALTNFISFDRIHLSASLSSSGLHSGFSFRCRVANLKILQNFCWNLYADLISFQLKATSSPTTPVVAHCLNASAPYCSIISSGEITLPKLLLIFLPSSPSTIPLITISYQGISPTKANDRRIV